MNDTFDSRHILVVKRQGNWRKMSSEVLGSFGFTVDTISDKTDAADLDVPPPFQPDDPGLLSSCF